MTIALGEHWPSEGWAAAAFGLHRGERPRMPGAGAPSIA
jgi:hypothetical protein